MGLSEEQVKTVKTTIPLFQQHGDQITKVFYSNMLSENPELNSIFSATNQQTGAQSKALAGALLAYASNIDNLGALSPAVERICKKHALKGVEAKQYEMVGKYLLAAMGEVLGDAITADELTAWRAAYDQLANIMIGKELELNEN